MVIILSVQTMKSPASVKRSGTPVWWTEMLAADYLI